MRATPSASLLAWPRRICRPWFIATGLGLAMGWSLLWMGAAQERAELPDSYAEPAPRAATHDWLTSSGGMQSGQASESFEMPLSISAAATSEAGFSPAAPISADAVPSDAVLFSGQTE